MRCVCYGWRDIEHDRVTGPEQSRDGFRREVSKRRGGASAACLSGCCASSPLRPTDTADAGLGVDAWRGVEVLPHPRVVTKERGDAVAELIGHILRRLPFIDEQRGEAGAQVPRADALCAVKRRRPVGQPPAAAGRKFARASCPSRSQPTARWPGWGSRGRCRVDSPTPSATLRGRRRGNQKPRGSLMRDAALRRPEQDRSLPDSLPSQRQRLGLRTRSGVGEEAEQGGRPKVLPAEAPAGALSVVAAARSGTLAKRKGSRNWRQGSTAREAACPSRRRPTAARANRAGVPP